MSGHIVKSQREAHEQRKTKNCGNCRKAWSMGRGLNNHVRFCDDKNSPEYRKCMDPRWGCERWEAETPKEVVKALMRQVGASA
jgi:hypothetical protein